MINNKRLFVASCVALVTTSLTFAIRVGLESEYCRLFHLSLEQIGYVLGTAFWGFVLSMVFGGFLCDLIGMKKMLILAFFGHLFGIILTALSNGFWTLYCSTLLVGLANGMVEAVCNPLISSMYPQNKTVMLNRFHVWFPGGIVIGGLVVYVFNLLNIPSIFHLCIIVIPTILYGCLFWGETLPITERVSNGISYRDMLKSCLNPLFFIMIFSMLLTSATELGTNQWISNFLQSVGMPSILLLVYINLIMALARRFAGGIVHSISTIGVLIFSAIFSCIGLLLFGYVVGYYALVPATIFAIEIAFFWPTMLGYVSEVLPKTGALGISLMGGAGMLSVSIILPMIGKFYDEKMHSHLAELSNGGVFVEGDKIQMSTLVEKAKLLAGIDALQKVALMPLVLAILFIGIYLVVKNKSNVSRMNT